MKMLKTKPGVAPLSMLYEPGEAAAKRGLHKSFYDIGSVGCVVDDDVALSLGTTYKEQLEVLDYIEAVPYEEPIIEEIYYTPDKGSLAPEVIMVEESSEQSEYARLLLESEGKI
jgi:hypothetical protein